MTKTPKNTPNTVCSIQMWECYEEKTQWIQSNIHLEMELSSHNFYHHFSPPPLINITHLPVQLYPSIYHGHESSIMDRYKSHPTIFLSYDERVPNLLHVPQSTPFSNYLLYVQTMRNRCHLGMLSGLIVTLSMSCNFILYHHQSKTSSFSHPHPTPQSQFTPFLPI